MKSFKNKVAAITGAASGMGRELAVELAKAGCSVALSDVNEAGLAETAALARAFGVKVTSQKLDVAKREAVYAWADQVVADHGKVNLIFNNAGVALGSTIDGMSYEDFEWLMGINFWGVVYGTKAFLPHLKASGDGHIINTSSIFGLAGIPSQSAYNAAKFAVRGFTESLRQELDIARSGVSATSVHPGGIKTNIAAAARFSDNMQDFTGKEAKQAKANFEKLFITTANSAAKTILKAVQKDSRRVLVGPDAVAFDAMVRMLPTGYQKLVAWGTRRQMAG
ncbi:SDR family oxidoreductase [Solimonas sp. K1W22B-7]|uniref:SDR family NAD(P)-dependent oxidoreductase n=1 Tax=Solimonas sp. K1W22B-7 TaxID=2303331 RepID=UPI000E3345D3|nr:SDR family oxidoreductase [Solimonas sp. K1W22B-7]AXQ29998.1 SDR family oxidoreductase [Solimonas sp. K1W22B-7]